MTSFKSAQVNETNEKHVVLENDHKPDHRTCYACVLSMFITKNNDIYVQMKLVLRA